MRPLSIPTKFSASIRHRLADGVLALLTVLWAAMTTAAEYPERPIRLIVASAPGGSPDINSRLVAAELGKRLGQHIRRETAKWAEVIKRTGAKAD